MRISIFLLCLLLGFSGTIRLPAQNPDAQQDAEAAREKLLKAEDELDNIQANSETTKVAVDGMKADVTRLQSDLAKTQVDNASLHQQLADLQAAFDKSEAARVKERQVLLDEVAKLVASGSGPGKTKPAAKKKDATAPAPVKSTDGDTSPAPAKNPDTTTNAATPSALTPPADAAPSSTDTTTSPPADQASPPPVKTQKGYYHIVASGETLTLICSAYRQEGVKVSVGDVQKANGLTDKSVLKVGQKLFIPKPGT